MDDQEGPRAAALAQLRKGVAPYCALALLSGRARALADADVVAGAGSVYPMLSRLQADGWVISQWRQTGDGAPRKYYLPTATGRSTLQTFLELWPRFVADIGGILESGTAGARGEDGGDHG